MIVEDVEVVLAEDDDGHATLVRRNLRRAGIRRDPIRVRDGQELLDYLYRRGGFSSRPGLGAAAIVLDLNMPRLGGIDALRQLKADNRVPFPVFVFTTTDDPVEILRCYGLGAAGCLLKPLDFGRFGDMVQQLAGFLMTVRLPGEPVSETDA
jgi:CheY-like chemotaxis protein